MERGSSGESKREEIAEAMMGSEALTSYDCGLGLSFTKTAKKVYDSLPLELKANLNRFLDYLIGPYPNFRKFRVNPGFYSYKDEKFIILYKVAKSPHPDVEYLLTVHEIKLRWQAFLSR